MVNEFAAACLMALSVVGQPAEVCTDPAYGAAYKKVANVDRWGFYHFDAIVVYVGQPVGDDIVGYWTYEPVSVKSFPGVRSRGVVIGLPDRKGGINRFADLPGTPKPKEIYRTFLKSFE